jgi:acetolactate synthase-1/2/3 large subunit
VPLVGAVDRVLQEMIQLLKESGRLPDSDAIKTWWEQIQTWRAIDCLAYEQNHEVIKPQFVVEKLYDVTNGNALVTSDVGQHQMFVAQFYKFTKPRQWINSGGLGTMGFGLPAAMGVQLAYPDETVVCVTGEASIQMCIQELSTCKQFDLPIKIVTLNNRYMGMVRQWQEMFYDKRYSHTYMEALPDLMKLADSYGHVGMRIEKPSDVEGALKEGLAIKDRLVFMDFIIDQDTNVYPMVAAGKAHNEMVLSPDREIA